MEIQSIDFSLNKFLPSISRKVKCTVLITFFFGFVTHISSITNLLVNWDVVSHLIVPDYKFLIAQGKPGMVWMRGLLGAISIGSLNSVYAITFISLAAGLVVSILEFKSIVSSCLVGLVMVTFPAVMCTFGYDSEDLFYSSMLLSVLSAYLVKNRRSGWIWGTLLLTFSLLSYQAYIGMTAGLFLFLCLLDLLSSDKPMKTIVLQGSKYITVLLASCGLYYVVLHIILNVMGLPLSTYRGIDKMGFFELNSIPTLVKDSYLKVLTFFARDAYGTREYSFAFLYCFVLVCFIGYMVYYIVCNKVYKQPFRLLLLLILLLLIPLSLHLVGVLGQNAKTHWLMIYPFCLVFVFLLKLSDLAAESTEALKHRAESQIEPYSHRKTLMHIELCFLPQCLIWLLMIVQVFGWFNLTNMGYTRMRIGYETDYAVCVQINSAISANPDFQPGTKVAIIEPYHISAKDPLEHMSSFTGISGGEIFYEFWLFPYMLRAYLSTQYDYASQQEREAIINSEEFKVMSCYPYNGFTKMIEGILVVKMSDDRTPK